MTGSAVDRATAVLAEHQFCSDECDWEGDDWNGHAAAMLSAAGLLPAALPVDRADVHLRPISAADDAMRVLAAMRAVHDPDGVCSEIDCVCQTDFVDLAVAAVGALAASPVGRATPDDGAREWQIVGPDGDLYRRAFNQEDAETVASWGHGHRAQVREIGPWRDAAGQGEDRA